MDTSKHGTIPMQPNVDLSKAQGPSTPAEVMRMKEIPYASAVGSIMYAVRCIRPDIAFSQNLTSRYQQNPGESHWTAVKNMLKYLRNTKDMFIVYGGDPTTELSITCSIDWKSSKQSTTVMSFMEAEYIAAFEVAMEVIWIRKFIFGLGVVPNNDRPMDMYCDNTGAITIADELGVQKADMLEKTFSTFHASNINLQQQYRLQNFERYSDLNVNLLVAENNNELLMKNHQTRPTGSLALPEENAVNNNDNKNSRSKRERGNLMGVGVGVAIMVTTVFPTETILTTKVVIMVVVVVVVKEITLTMLQKLIISINKIMKLVPPKTPKDPVLGVEVKIFGQKLVARLHIYKFKMSLNGAQYQAKDGELCIADSGATHTILKSKKYFLELKPTKGTIDTISGPTNLIDGVGKANVVLSHPGSTMMKRIVENTHGHPLKDQKFPKIDKVTLCTSCSLGKLIARSLPLKVKNESPMFLERIQGDICGLIHLPCGPFRYFMVLIDTSSRWSHVSLLSTRNVALAKFLAQIIKLRAHFPDYTVKRVRLDNAGEFTSHAFNDYCMSVGIVVEHPVAHVHTQNGLAKSLIKRLQLIARPLI
ncbi:disease resistance CC-NBS-LRR class family protein [Tanacetum coccineum]